MANTACSEYLLRRARALQSSNLMCTWQVKARQALAAEIGKKSLVADVDAVADDDDNDADDDDDEEAHNVPRKTEAMPAAAPGPRYRDGKWFKFRGGGGRRKPLGKVHRRG